jgi:hypothetical protein
VILPVQRLKFPIEPLVNQMLDQLPADVWTSSTTTFLDPAMAGGQFLVEIQRRLRLAGHTDENIADRVWGLEINKLRVNYAKNNKKLVFNNLLISDFLRYNWLDMKFDVIVGNPPYQMPDKPNSHNLWTQFVELGFDLLKSNGFLGMVTPNIGRRAPVLNLIQTHTLVYYNGSNVRQYFPGVGSTFCSWVLQNQVSSGSCTVVHAKTGIEHLVLPDDLPFVPLDLCKDSLEFIGKMTAGASKLGVRTDLGYHSQGKKTWYAEEQSAKFPYRVQNTGSSTRWCSHQHPGNSLKKVICSKSGYLNPWYDAGTTGVTENSWVVLVNTQQEADRVIEFLNSDEVKRFVGLANGGTSLANDPAVYRQLVFDIDKTI